MYKTLIRHKPIQIEILYVVVKHLLEFNDTYIYVDKQVHSSKWGNGQSTTTI